MSKLTGTAHTFTVDMSEETYHLTKEDIRKTESKASQAHRGNVPADSDAAGLQVSSIPKFSAIQDQLT